MVWPITGAECYVCEDANALRDRTGDIQLVKLPGNPRRRVAQLVEQGFSRWSTPGLPLSSYEANGYNDREEEFGEARLMQVLEVNRNLEISALLTKLLKEVNQFSAGKQSDDVTAIVARVTTHEGKQILLVDLSNCPASEVERIIRALPELVTIRHCHGHSVIPFVR
jgi:hypothetical protein